MKTLTSVAVDIKTRGALRYIAKQEEKTMKEVIRKLVVDKLEELAKCDWEYLEKFN